MYFNQFFFILSQHKQVVFVKNNERTQNE